MGFYRNKNDILCIPDCPDRTPGCQDHCEHFRKKKADLEHKKQLEKERHVLDGYEIDRHIRITKKQNKRR